MNSVVTIFLCMLLQMLVWRGWGGPGVFPPSRIPIVLLYLIHVCKHLGGMIADCQIHVIQIKVQ